MPIKRALTSLAAAAAVLASGCGDDGDTGKAGSSITFQVAGAPDEFELYREVAESYEKATGVEVKVIEVPDEESFGTKLATSIAAGRPPDVALISYRGYEKYAAKNQFVALDDVDTGDYYSEPIKAFTYDGRLQCLPQNLSSLVVYYNAELFERAGLEPPADDWTYPDAIAAARKIQGLETPNGKAYGVSIEKELIRLAPFVWSAGGELFDDAETPSRLTLDSPATRRGLENYLALGELGPDIEEAESTGEDPLFLEGRLGMVFASRRKTPTYRQAKFDWDVAPFPKDRERVTVLHTDGFCALKGGNEAEAIKFVEYAGGAPGQKVLTALGRVVPSVRSLAESAEFLGSAPPGRNQVFVDAEKHMRVLPTVPNSPAIEITAERALEQAYFGRIGVDELIERLEEETAPLFAGAEADAEALEELEREEEAEEERERESGEEPEEGER